MYFPHDIVATISGFVHPIDGYRVWYIFGHAPIGLDLRDASIISGKAYADYPQWIPMIFKIYEKYLLARYYPRKDVLARRSAHLSRYVYPALKNAATNDRLVMVTWDDLSRPISREVRKLIRWEMKIRYTSKIEPQTFMNRLGEFAVSAYKKYGVRHSELLRRAIRMVIPQLGRARHRFMYDVYGIGVG